MTPIPFNERLGIAIAGIVTIVAVGFAYAKASGAI